MKISLGVLFMVVCVSGMCGAQDQTDAWNGTVRFNPADLFINLHNALPGMYATWTPYVLPNLGVPVEVDVNVGWGVLPGVEVSLLSGAEYIPVGPAGKNKSGLFLDAKIGLSLFIHEGAHAAFVANTDAGYQLITKKGFVFTPAVGAVYNGRTGFGLNVMLDLGFAY
jgi:hypothetical protein